jgi:murein DD-endopeptidase MepM/ murein hydrolase activator NlpD
MGSSGSCAGCGDEITLVHARPVVGGDGRVALWCRTCWPRRDAIARGASPVSAVSSASSITAPSPSRSRPASRNQPRRPRSVSAIELPSPPAARKRSTMVAVAAGLTIAAAAAVAVIGTATPAKRAAKVSVAAAVTAPPEESAAPTTPAGDPAASGAARAPATDEGTAGHEPATDEGTAEHEPVTDEGTADPAATVDSQAEPIDLATLEEERPTLLDWVHPVTGTDEPVPLRGTRKFGARREGLSRTLCGNGHCGVDLSGPRGRPVVAVAWGTVVRVEHSARGRDGRSGRYVRVAHPEGVFTSYMHLDAISADIKVGDDVDAGTVLGSLGKTGIYHGEQHLHFGLEIEDHGALVYVDPTPFLSRAQVMPVPDQPLNLLPPDDREQW